MQMHVLCCIVNRAVAADRVRVAAWVGDAVATDRVKRMAPTTLTAMVVEVAAAAVKAVAAVLRAVRAHAAAATAVAMAVAAVVVAVVAEAAAVAAAKVGLMVGVLEEAAMRHPQAERRRSPVPRCQSISRRPWRRRRRSR